MVALCRQRGRARGHMQPSQQLLRTNRTWRAGAAEEGELME